MDNVQSLKATFSSISEQTKLLIGRFQTYIQKINKSISASEKVIALLQESRTALISAAVTGKIDVRDHIFPPTNTPENKTSEQTI